MALDVHVVGGGPAGCFAGIAALQAGQNVLLSEEHAEIGRPEACSGLVSQSGLESLLPYVNYRQVMINSISAAKIFSGAREFSIRPQREKAVLISRCGLDKMAGDRFESEGGKLRLGQKVTRQFEAKNVIGADGPASSVADFFGFPKIGRFIACLQGDFHYSCEDAHQAEIYLSSRDFPGFFGWAIPVNEEKAEIGVGVALPRHPLPYYRRFLSRLRAKGRPQREFAAVIPAAVRRRTGMQKGGYSVLLAGDSAGQVKATTGGGIFFGSQCGLIAGKNAGRPLEYERKWREKFGLDLALHSRFRTLLNVGGGEPHGLFLSAAKALLFEELLSKEGRMDRWGEMLSPPVISAYAGMVAGRLTGRA